MEAGCPASSTHVPSQPVRSAAPRCFVLFDRHVQKNGGSTLSTMMRRLEEHGECTYWGYDVTNLDALWATSRTLSNESRVLPRLCIEAHVGRALHHMSRAVMHDFEMWSSRMAARGMACKLWRVLRVREPLSHYISFYTWQVMGNTDGIPPGSNFSNLGASPSDGFLRWMNATRNLQASILLRPMAAYDALLPPEKRKPFQTGHFIPLDDEEEAMSQLHELADHFELVAPLERFDEALLLTASELGLRNIQHVRHDPYCLSRKRLERPFRVDLDERAGCSRLAAAARECSHIQKACARSARAECRAAARRAAPLDFKLYELAARRFQKQVRQRGAELAASVASFRAATVGSWRGGAPVTPRCKFLRLPTATKLLHSSPGAQNITLRRTIGGRLVSPLWKAPNFESAGYACTQAPQRVAESAWSATGFLGQGLLVPNRPECFETPLTQAQVDTCSLPLQPSA